MPLYELKTEKRVASQMMEERKPTDLTHSFTKKGDFSLYFTLFNEDEVEALKGADLPFEVEVKMWEKGCEEGASRTLTERGTLPEVMKLFVSGQHS